jgi:hypothetical protein
MLNNKLNLILSFLIYGLSSTASAFTVSSDVDYYTYSDGFYNYIYSDTEREYVDYLIHYNKAFRKQYEHDFQWQFDENPTLILPSQKNQISNGFATISPRLYTVFYGGGADMIDYFTSASWAFTLLSHETAHLYQLNVKRGLAKMAKSVFGDAGLSIVPPTYIIYANIFLPTFILEGNATMNEGRFGAGGRLYSGHSRALLLQLSKNGLVTSQRLMNDHKDYPYGAEKYLVGGFFNNYLAEKYGADKTNTMFYSHTKHMFWPFHVNKALVQSVGVGYEGAISGLNSSWKTLADKQMESRGRVIAETKFHTPMTRDGNDILVLTNDGLSDPRLWIVKSSTDLKKESLNIPSGRVFKTKDGEWASASSETIKNNELKFGLFTEGYNHVDGTTDKVFYDKQKNNELYARADESFVETQLYLNKQKLGPTNSSAIIADDGAVYRFLQAGKTRTMMKGDIKLFSYKGYYGHPVDVDYAGNVYFVGPSESGSSLFRWQAQTKKIEKANASDICIDAKIIKDENKAVIIEVKSDSYKVVVDDLKFSAATPFEYTFKYEKEKSFELYDTHPKVSPSVKKEKEESYSHIGNLEYTGVNPFIFLGRDSYPIFSAIFNFSDPMEKNAISLGIGRGEFDANVASLTYTNMNYFIHWFLGGQFQQIVEVDYDKDTEEYNVEERYDNWVGFLGIEVPYFSRPQWNASLRSTYFYSYENGSAKYTKPRDDNRNTVLTQNFISRKKTAPLGFYSQQNLQLELAHEYINNAPGVQENDERAIYAAQLSLFQDVFSQTYLGLTAQVAQTDSDQGEIKIDRQSILSTEAATRFTHVASINDLGDVRFIELQKYTFEIRQAFDLSLYFSKFPFSLRGFSLIGFYNQYYGSLLDDKSSTSLFNEVGGGSEIELLFLHRFPIRILFLGAESDIDDSTEFSLTMGGQWHF